MNFSWCHGPMCHTSRTTDRVRGQKGSKVLRTRKVNTPNITGICMAMVGVQYGIIFVVIVVKWILYTNMQNKS